MRALPCAGLAYSIMVRLLYRQHWAQIRVLQQQQQALLQQQQQQQPPPGAVVVAAAAV